MKVRLVLVSVTAVVASLFAQTASATFISPESVTDPGSLGFVTNGAGGTLQADPNLINDATSTTYVAPSGLAFPDDTWARDNGASDGTGYQFDMTLDQNYDLTKFYLWNYRSSNPVTGVLTFSLATSSTTSGENFGTAANFTADLLGAGAAGTVDEHAFSASNVRRVRFTILTLVGHVGLHEFAFEGTPVSEPGSVRTDSAPPAVSSASEVQHNHDLTESL